MKKKVRQDTFREIKRINQFMCVCVCLFFDGTLKKVEVSGFEGTQGREKGPKKNWGGMQKKKKNIKTGEFFLVQRKKFLISFMEGI